MIELKDGSISNVGAPTKSASAKLYDIEHTEVREFGDTQVKLVFADDDGNEVQVALDHDVARDVSRNLESLSDDSPVFE